MRRQQSGAAAVEFALVFPILFLLIYGVIVYSYLFVIQESITYTAQEAAEATVAVDPETGTDADRSTRARDTARAILAWMPQNQRERVLGDASGSAVGVQHFAAGTNAACPSDSDCVIVTLTFNVATPNNLFPVITLPGIGALPPMPTALIARAVVRV